MMPNNEPTSHQLRGSLAPEAPRNEFLLGLSGEAEEIKEVLGGKAKLVIGAEITGASHFSKDRIDTFREDIAEVNPSGKFGPGTYFAIGELGGETVDLLKSNGSVRHDVSINGNILVINRDDIKEIEAILLEELSKYNPLYKRSEGTPKLKTTIKNAALSKYLGELNEFRGGIDGQSIDAVVIYMDNERTAAEMVVLPKSTSKIRIIGAGPDRHQNG